MSKRSNQIKIGFVMTPNMLVTSLTNAYELFYAAIQTAQSHDSTQQQIILEKVALDNDRQVMPSGLSLSPDKLIGKTQYDLIFIPALWRNPRPIIKQHPELIEWLQYQYQHGAILNATGTGVCLMAAADLLDGKPATTHWHYFEQFAKDYPLVKLKRQHFITNANRLYCAASINALTDLSLHHIHHYFGREVSEHLSRHFSYEARRPYEQLSFVEDANSNHPDEQILQAQLWIQDNLARSTITINELAKNFGMSLRNFARRFKQATEITPLAYLQQQRIKMAKSLLQNTNLRIKEIAYRVGYLDESYFSQIFKKETSLTPRNYRKTVRAKLYSST